MNKEYTHVVDLEDDDDVPAEIEIDLETGEQAPAAPEPAVEPPSASKSDPEPEDDDGPTPPDPRDRRIAELEQKLAGVQNYLTDAERRAQAAGKVGEIQKVDQKIAEAKARLRKATEAGDAEAVAEATDELTEYKVEKRVLMLSGDQDDAPAPAPQRQPAAPGVVPQASEWMQRNAHWFDKPEYRAESLLARAIDMELAEEGWPKNSTSYYRELNKRLAAKTRIQPADIGGPTKRTTPAPATAAPRSAGAAVAKGKIVIGKEDQRMMRLVGLDPSNKDHLREYARQKAKGE